MMIDREQPTDVDAGTVVAELAQLAQTQREQDGQPPSPLMAGTFAMYPMDDGGLMLVADLTEGAKLGTHRARMSPTMLRALMTLANGGPAAVLGKMLRRHKGAPGGG